MNDFALLGCNISYSISPALHTKFFRRLGIKNAGYGIVDSGDSMDKITSFLLDSYDGFNVTKPYKVDIIPYLDEVDDLARRIGSVNTVVRDNRKLIGYNTDFYGIIETFNFDNISVKNKRCLMIGYGGVARTVAYALHELGAKSIYVTGRNIDKIHAFVDNIEDFRVGVDKNVDNEYDIVINATSVGTGGEDKTPIDVELISGIEYYFDLVYSPRKTVLMRKLEKKGIKCRDGLYMLVVQAAKSDEYYFNIEVPRRMIYDVYLELAGEIFNKMLKDSGYKNIFLLGFMGSGKSTVGKKLANILNKNFYDTDKLIEDKYGSIPKIFEEKGEEYFRQIESKVLKDVANLDGVIATGGGIVMRDDNIDSLSNSDSSLKILLKANFDVIEDRVKGSQRPLFQDKIRAKALFDYRTFRYALASDLCVNADGSIDEVVDNILRLNL